MTNTEIHFTGLCNECFSSNKLCEVFRDSGLAVCVDKCLPKLKRIAKKKAISAIGTVMCTCRPCAIHENEPMAVSEEVIKGETVEG